jgi:dnd system-associated protein 4
MSETASTAMGRPNRDRYYVQADKHAIFQAWGKDDETSPFPTLKDVLLFSAAVGWSYGKRVPLRGGRQHVGFWRAFSPQEDVPFIQALAIAETQDPAVVGDYDRMLSILEEYANGGIDIVVQQERYDRDSTVAALAGLVVEAHRDARPLPTDDHEQTASSPAENSPNPDDRNSPP